MTFEEWKEKYKPTKELIITRKARTQIYQEISTIYEYYIWTKKFINDELFIIPGKFVGTGESIFICENAHIFETNDNVQLNITRKMDRSIELVEEFMKTFKQPVLIIPTIPSQERCNLRVNLLKEELKEFETAIEKGDIVEIFDALLDLKYVLNGAFSEFGLSGAYPEGFKEVHRSNMTKVHATEELAKSTQDHYLKEGIPCDIELHLESYLVIRKSDKKILKSIYYSPAQLAPIIKKYQDKVK